MSTATKQRGGAVRKVTCTHCDGPCEVGRRAMSIFCPHCRKRLILEDFKLKGYHGVREFATCGSVLVEKSGHIAARIKVGDLVVKGTVLGDVISRGCVRVHKTGSLQGDIRAPILRVDIGAKLNGFLQIGEIPTDAVSTS